MRAALMRTRWKNDYLVALAVLSVLTAAYVTAALSAGGEPSRPLLALSSFISICLVAMWIDLDSRGRPEIYRPYDYGWLVYLYWIPYFPYYFWRTRGVKGLLAFAGIPLLLLSWEIIWLIADAFFL